MIANAQDVKTLPKFEYFNLPEQSRPNAREAVLNEEIKSLNRKIAIALQLAKQNINLLINQSSCYAISALVRHKAHIQRLTNDVKRLEGNIDDNYCIFLEDGTYVLSATSY